MPEQQSDRGLHGQGVRMTVKTVPRSKRRRPACWGEEDEQEPGGRVGLTFRARRTYLSCLPCRAHGVLVIKAGCCWLELPHEEPHPCWPDGEGHPRGFRLDGQKAMAAVGQARPKLNVDTATGPYGSPGVSMTVTRP